MRKYLNVNYFPHGYKVLILKDKYQSGEQYLK